MKKLAFCLVLLGLCSLTFAGCQDKPKPKPSTGPASGAPAAGEPAPPADAPAAEHASRRSRH